jgi:serine/threonine protein kinase
MLCFDPSERITVPDALEHSWLSAYHDPLDEPDCPEKFEKWREIEKLSTMEEFREAIWNEIEDYRREIREIPALLPPLPSSLVSSSIPGLFEVNYLPYLSGTDVVGDELSNKPTTETTTAQNMEVEKAEEAEDVLPDIISSVSPDHHRRSITAPTDPLVTYARRSSILQPSRQGSTYNSPMASTHVPPFVDGAANADKLTQGSVAFPTQGFVIPARSRTGSTVGGEVTRRILRTLSTVSIHESAERVVGGLAGIAPIGKYITEMNTEADAPPSEVPKDFGIESEEETNENESSQPKRGRFVIG